MGRGEEVWSHDFRSLMQGIAGICIDPKSAVIFLKFPEPSTKKKINMYISIIFSYLYELLKLTSTKELNHILQ